MDRTTIENKVADITVYNLGVDPDDVKPEARFVDDLGADSLDTVELVMAAEEEFNIDIDDDEAEKVLTVADAVNLIEQKLKETTK